MSYYSVDTPQSSSSVSSASQNYSRPRADSNAEMSQFHGRSNDHGTIGPFAEIQEGISSLQKNNAKIQRMIVKIGTKADNAEFRDRISSERSNNTALAKRIMQLLKNASAGPNAQHNKQLLAKFSIEFDKEFRVFQGLVNTLDSRQSEILNQVEQNKRLSNDVHSDQYQHNQNNNQYNYMQQQQQQQQQLAQDLDIQFLEYTVDELNKRHDEIVTVERDVLEIAEMFKDLQNLVNEQQEDLDLIDGNINEAKEKVETGHKELLAAEDYQKRARKKKCCMLFIVLAIVGAIVGFIYLKKS